MSIVDLLSQEISSGTPGWDRLEVFLIRHEASLDRLRKAVMKPGFGYVMGQQMTPEEARLIFPAMTEAERADQIDLSKRDSAAPPPDLMSMFRSPIGANRIAGFLFAADARRAAAANYAKVLSENIIALLQIADHTDENRTLSHQFTARSINITLFHLCSDLLTNSPTVFSNEHLRDLAHAIAAVRTYRFDTMPERLFLYDMVQRVYTDDGNGNGHLDMDGYLEYMGGFTPMTDDNMTNYFLYEVLFDSAMTVGVVPAFASVAADRIETLRLIDHIYGLMEKDLDVPIWVQPMSESERALEETLDDSIASRARHPVLSDYMVGLGGLRRTAERYGAVADGVLLGIALELYWREHGEFPSKLDSLIPRFMSELPVDRINGAPLKYRLVDGRPLVYSVGIDLKDDGGRLPRDRDGEPSRMGAACWPVNDRGQEVEPSVMQLGDWLVWPNHPNGYESPLDEGKSH